MVSLRPICLVICIVRRLHSRLLQVHISSYLIELKVRSGKSSRPARSWLSSSKWAYLDSITVNICRHRCCCVGWCQAVDDSVNRAASVYDDEHELDHRATGTVRRDGKVDLGCASAVGIYGIRPRLVIEPVRVRRARNYRPVGHHPIHVREAAVAVKRSHGHTVTGADTVLSEDLARDAERVAMAKSVVFEPVCAILPYRQSELPNYQPITTILYTSNFAFFSSLIAAPQ